jgi:hypothetical protein
MKSDAVIRAIGDKRIANVIVRAPKLVNIATNYFGQPLVFQQFQLQRLGSLPGRFSFANCPLCRDSSMNTGYRFRRESKNS